MLIPGRFWLLECLQQFMVCIRAEAAMNNIGLFVDWNSFIKQEKEGGEL